LKKTTRASNPYKVKESLLSKR